MNILETPRLRLRPWRMEDLEDFYGYCKDPVVGPMAGWKPHQSMEESRQKLAAWVDRAGPYWEEGFHHRRCIASRAAWAASGRTGVVAALSK